MMGASTIQRKSGLAYFSARKRTKLSGAMLRLKVTGDVENSVARFLYRDGVLQSANDNPAFVVAIGPNQLRFAPHRIWAKSV